MNVGKRRYGTVGKDLNANRRFHALGGEAARLYCLICSQKDDNGNYTADPIIVRTECYKVVDNKTIDEETICRHIAELSRLGMIVLYDADGEPLMHVVDHVCAGGSSFSRYSPPTHEQVTVRSPITDPATLFRSAKRLDRGNVSSDDKDNNGHSIVPDGSLNGHSTVTIQSPTGQEKAKVSPVYPNPRPEPETPTLTHTRTRTRNGAALITAPVKSVKSSTHPVRSGLEGPSDSDSDFASTPQAIDRLGLALWETMQLPPNDVLMQLSPRGAKARQIRADQTDLIRNIVPAILAAGDSAVAMALKTADEVKTAQAPMAALKSRLRDAGLEIPVGQ